MFNPLGTSNKLPDDEVDCISSIFVEGDDKFRWDAEAQRIYFLGEEQKPEDLDQTPEKVYIDGKEFERLTVNAPFVQLLCPEGYPGKAKISFQIDCDVFISAESSDLQRRVNEGLKDWWVLQEVNADEMMGFNLALELQQQLSEPPKDEEFDEDFEKFEEKPIQLFDDPAFTEALQQAGFKPFNKDAGGRVMLWSYFSKIAGDIKLTGHAADYKQYLYSPYDILLDHSQLNLTSSAQYFYFNYTANAHAEKDKFAKDIVYWAVEQLNNMNSADQIEGEDEDSGEVAETDLMGYMPTIEEIHDYLKSKGVPVTTLEALEKKLSERQVTICSWGTHFYGRSFGAEKLRTNGVTSQNNIDACILNGSHSGNAVNNGTSARIQHNVASCSNFRSFMLMAISKIERNDLRTLGVNCHKGRHRSVAAAELLKRGYYKTADVKHLTLSRAE